MVGHASQLGLSMANYVHYGWSWLAMDDHVDHV